jgi:hypothetical protein
MPVYADASCPMPAVYADTPAEQIVGPGFTGHRFYGTQRRRHVIRLLNDPPLQVAPRDPFSCSWGGFLVHGLARMGEPQPARIAPSRPPLD